MRSVVDVFKWSHSYLRQATALAVVFFVCVPALVLGSLSLLSDACQRRNREPWLGGCRWVATGCWWVSGWLLGASFYHCS